MKDGVPGFTYNFLGLERYVVASSKKLAAAPATIILEFEYDGGGLGKGGLAKISVNDGAKGEARVERTQPNIFSADETVDIGLDMQTPVAEGIGYGPEETKFTGTINKVVVKMK